MKISSFNIFDRELEKYLFKKFIKNFIFFISISLLIVFLVEFVELLRRTSENPNISSMFYVLYLAFLKITESIAFIIPISIFVTTMITCRSFNRHREMVIIQNAGLHSFRILYPFIVFTIFFCVIYFIFLNPFFSHATNAYQKIEQEVFRGKLSKASISKSGIWLRQGSENNKIVIRAANFLPKESLFKDTTFYIYTKKNNFIERIDAETVQLEKNFWVMKNVIINKPNKKVVKIDEYTLKTNLSIKKIEDDYRKVGDLGLTASNILKLKTQTTFTAEKITLERVYETLFKIAKLEGKGSQDLKMKHISSLLNDATPLEAKFVLKILLGTLRLGVAENTVMDALAIAFTGKKENKERIENAYNVSSDLGKVSLIVATDGIDEIKKFKISLFSPIRPMLADRVQSEKDVIKKMPEQFAAEYKLDGERVQIHKQANKIILFSRRLENITQYYPDIVENIGKSLNVHEGIFEAEIVPINENTGEFLPFQELMHRRRKYKLEQAVSQYPITVNFFDVLYFDNKDCLNLEYSERRKILEKLVNEDNFSKLVPMLLVKNENEVGDFLENSINAGCEGLMLKTPSAPYRAGSRGSNWLKLKREYRNELGDSLDLIVIGAYFGRGRRTGLYGTLLLGTYNPEKDNFPSICKVGTGFTDESLDQLYQILSNNVTLKKNSRIISEMEADVWLEPELVLEIVASEITLSPIHKTGLDLIRKNSGFALRFPKFTGKIRYEKAVEDASTVEEVLTLYKRQSKINQEI